MGETVELEVFTPEKLDIYWPHISQQLDLVPNTWSEYSKQEIESYLREGELLAWGVGKDKIDLVLFTRFVTRKQGIVLQLVWAGGTKLDECLDMIDATMERCARNNNCFAIEIIDTRGGWIRKLRPRGFRMEYAVLSRPVWEGPLN